MRSLKDGTSDSKDRKKVYSYRYLIFILKLKKMHKILLFGENR